jgi:hypothetical protein
MAIATMIVRLGFQQERVLQELIMIDLLYIMNSMGNSLWFLEEAFLSFLGWKRDVLFRIRREKICIYF